jgi:eukaryotic-like serine/threonine-protein kinase
MKSPKPIHQRQRRATLPQMGEVLEGRYELVRIIGEGGMGVVVEARDQRLERTVAIKLMHSHLTKNDDFVRRFEREVLIAKDLEHTNTVRIYDVGVTDDRVTYLVMEYLEGRELKELIEEGPLSFEQVFAIGEQLLDGLADAHAIDVVHRDLKPGNIFISRDRRDRLLVKILDFGIAKSLGESHQAITATGDVVGTGPYLAPELYMHGECTKAADVYACGLIMLEMLFGRRVIEASTLGQTMSRHLHMPVVLPETLAAHPLSSVLSRAVHKRGADRFADADEMLEALQQIEQDCGLGVIPQREIDRAFEQMDEAFTEHARSLLPSPPSEGSDGTMELDEEEVEILASQSLSSPRTPTDANTAETNPALPQRTELQAPSTTPMPAKATSMSKAAVVGLALAALLALAGVTWLAIGGTDKPKTPADDSAPATEQASEQASPQEPSTAGPAHAPAAHDEVAEHEATQDEATQDEADEHEAAEAVADELDALDEPDEVVAAEDSADEDSNDEDAAAAGELSFSAEEAEMIDQEPSQDDSPEPEPKTAERSTDRAKATTSNSGTSKTAGRGSSSSEKDDESSSYEKVLERVLVE